MRLFLTIELPAIVRDNLVQMQERLAQTGADVRWTPQEQLSLTVHALGDLPENVYSEVQESVALVATLPSFRFRVGGGSYFPRKGPPKTLWVGLKEGSGDWKNLVHCVEEPLWQMGVPKNQGLVPHITLGRVRSENNLLDLQTAIQAETTTDCGEGWATQITLVESFLLPTGAIHEKRESWGLAPLHAIT